MIGSSSSKLSGFGEMKYYSTGWVNCNDWTNQHLGTTVGGNVVHNLNTNLSDLIIRLFISSDGTENNAIEVVNTTGGSSSASEMRGTVYTQVDSNNFIIQTGDDGIRHIQADGTPLAIDTENWYYKVKVYKVAGNN